MNFIHLRRLAAAGAVCGLCLFVSSISHAGPIYTEPSPWGATLGISPNSLSDLATWITTVDPSPTAAANVPDSFTAAIPCEALALSPETARRNPLLAHQCGVAFARLAESPIDADSPLMAQGATARPAEIRAARFERLATFSLCDWAPSALAALSIAVHEYSARGSSCWESLSL